MTEEQAKAIIELLTEIRDEVYRQGNAFRMDGWDQIHVRVEKI